MSMFGPQINRKGYWSYRSETDPRWNCSGETMTNGFYGPIPEAEAALKAQKQRLGTPPNDLTFSYTKD